MLTPYAYLADGYLIFLRSLREFVRTKLAEEFGEDDSGWWEDPVLSAVAKKDRAQFRKNVEDLYVHQRHEKRALDPFENLDPSHCLQIILHHYSSVFQLEFPDKEEIYAKLISIGKTRNSRFAHPRNATPNAKAVSAALREMIYVLEQMQNDSYGTEIAQLTALASATDALAMAPSFNDADELQRTRGRSENESGPEDVLPNPSPPAEDHSDETVEPNAAQRLAVDMPADNDKTLSQITQAVRNRRASGDQPVPLRYVWARLEEQHPEKFPDETYLLEIVDRHPELFNIRRGANTASVRIAEARDHDR